jgi:hypothetical protein
MTAGLGSVWGSKTRSRSLMGVMWAGRGMAKGVGSSPPWLRNQRNRVNRQG